MGAPSGYKLERKWSFTHFLIGIFGALAILGVMAKIFNFEANVLGYALTWKPVVLVGFLGEAFVFILMGMMREFRYVPVDEDSPSGPGDSGSQDRDPTGASMGDGVLEDREPGFDVEEGIRREDERLTHEAEQLAQKVQETRSALAGHVDALKEVSALRDGLDEATGILSRKSESLGEQVEEMSSLYEAQTSMAETVHRIQEDLAQQSELLAEEIKKTQRAMKALRTQFIHVTRRFEQFNAPPRWPDDTSADGTPRGDTPADGTPADGTLSDSASAGNTAADGSS